MIMEAIDKAGYRAGEDVFLALDCAASEFYKDGGYVLSGEDKQFNSEGFSDYLADLVDRYPILSIEDGLDESDWTVGVFNQNTRRSYPACGRRPFCD